MGKNGILKSPINMNSHSVKIAYVNYRPSRGVLNKLRAIARIARESNLNFDVYVLSDEYSQDERDLVIKRLKFPKNKFRYKIAINFFRYIYILKSVNLSEYDCIILRYSGATDFSYLRFFKKYKGRIIPEFHSDLIGELSILEEGRINPLRIFMEKLNSPRLLSRAIGSICVTNELAQLYQDSCKRKIITKVISNGIDTDKIKFTNFRPFNGSELNIIFVASRISPWHGLDRLLKGFLHYEGDISINLHLIGTIESESIYSQIKEVQNSKINIISHGQLIGQELDDIFEECSIAVSSLAIFRNSISEACVLKTREYIARGIPFIYAYKDVDLTGKEIYAKRMVCDESNLKIDEIIGFAHEVSSSNDLSEEMREFAVNKLDWKYKLVEMNAFAESVLGINKN